MRRFAATALILGAISLLIVACSSDSVPTAPTDADVAGDGVKRSPIIHDPPPGFSQFLATLAARFDTITWVDHVVSISLEGGVWTIQPSGYAPIDIEFVANPEAVLPAGAPLEKDIIISVPAPPGGGTLYVPGNCIIYKTKDLPPPSTGLLTLRLPIMDFYDTSEFTGVFTSYYLGLNDQGYVDAMEPELIVLPEWPVPDPDPAVYVEVTGLKDKDPSSATERVLDSGAIGDE